MAKREDSRKSGIYTITSPSGKQYVGSAVNIDIRCNRHKRLLRTGEHYNRVLQNAANKYGVESLVFSRLLICRIEDLVIFEQRSIDILKPSYNICLMAGSMLGYKHTNESRKRMSEDVRRSDNAKRPENRAKIIEALRRPEVRIKVSGDNSPMKRPEARN